MLTVPISLDFKIENNIKLPTQQTTAFEDVTQNNTTLLNSKL